MRLVKYRVPKFKSVKGTNWIDIDDLACFVGLNESGKTNILLPLWKFNPAIEIELSKIDEVSDYPKDEEYTPDDPVEFFAEIVFKLEPAEKNMLNEFIKEKNKAIKEKESERKNNKQTSEEDNDDEAKEEIIKWKFDDYILIKKSYTNNFYIHLYSPDTGEESKDIDDTRYGETYSVFKKVLSLIPKFIYYADYGDLDSNIKLSEIVPNIDNISALEAQLQLKARTLKALFDFVGLDCNEIYELGKSTEDSDIDSRQIEKRTKKMEGASKALTKKFNSFWGQGTYKFELRVDGDIFRIHVADEKRPDKVELEYRSSGLKWYLNFFLLFSVESEGEHKGCVLLLDEPGSSLHPIAQQDLTKFFFECAKNNQILYTTHQPFLIDSNNTDKVKVVYTDEDGLTKVSNNLQGHGSEKDSLLPINAAIGITASESFLMGHDIIIVEGVSDVNYLNMIKYYLISKSFKLKNDIIFVPARGTSKLNITLSIIFGTKNDELPHILLDSDKAGVAEKNNIEEDIYETPDDKKKILLIGDFVSIPYAETEDIIPRDFIMDALRKMPDLELSLNSGQKFSPKSAIIPQIKKVATRNGKNLTDDENMGWKVEMSQIIKQDFEKHISSGAGVSEKIHKIWEDLFNAFQGIKP